MSNNKDILLPLQLHNDRFQPHHHIPITLPAPIPIIELVIVPRLIVLRVLFLDLLVCHAIAHARVELVERLPRLLFKGQFGAGLDGTLQGGRPHFEGSVTDMFLD